MDITLTHTLKSNPIVAIQAPPSKRREGFFSSFASSRQASASDLLPSPAALATRAQGEGSPPHAAAAPSQLRPLLHHRCQSSRLAHVIWWLLLFSSTTRAQTRHGCVYYPRGLAPCQAPRKAAGNSTSNAPRQRQFGVGGSSTSRSPSAASAAAADVSPAEQQ